MSSSEKKMLTLKSSDGETFEIEEIVALESQTIKHMVEDDCANNEIPLPNVTGRILAMVIVYCKQHANTDMTEDDCKEFDKDFFQKEDTDCLFELILAANYLHIEGLQDRACQEMADRIKEETVENVRKLFKIENDFTPEEEAKIREENAWSFE